MTNMKPTSTKKRNTMRGLKSLIVGACAISASTISLQADESVPLVTLNALSTFQKGDPAEIFDESAAEIVKYDPQSKRLFIVNGYDDAIDIVDIQDVTSPQLVSSIDVSSMGNPNSVDVNPRRRSNQIAVAIANNDPTLRGKVAFYNTDGVFLSEVQVGFLPDMLTYNKRGNRVLVANEGEPNDDYTVDPEGSVSIISNLNKSPRVREIGFNSLSEHQLEGVRITGKEGVTLTPGQDIEPEFIALDPMDRYAFVTLQENNAVAKINIGKGTIEAMLPLGSTDHSKFGYALDASNKDDAIRIANWPVNGLPMPDAIATYRVKGKNGKTYFLTANEGDGREREVEINGEDVLIYSDETRVKDVLLDPTSFPLATELQDQANLGRLKVVATEGNYDEDDEFEELFSFGTRSFSIYDSDGNLVYDSGSDFETIIADRLPAEFGSTNDENGSFDDRSDDKGPEPEAIEVGEIDGRTYAFIGLERIGGIMIYDITDPYDVMFIDYVNNRDFTGDAEAGTAGDLGPEGIIFIPAKDSPNGANLLVVANEVSGTTTIYEIVPQS